MTDPLLTHRPEEGPRFDLLTIDRATIGRLEGVRDSRIEANVNADIRVGGSLVLDDIPATPGTLTSADIDWLSHQIRIWWEVTGLDAWPLGTFVIAAPTLNQSDLGRSRTVELVDRTAMLQRAVQRATFALPAGEVVTEAIRGLLATVGGATVTDSAATLTSGRVWPAGTSVLRIVNDLAESINYGGVWCDGWGTFQCHPYVRPAARPLARTFARGELAIHAPEWTRDEDIFTVPNLVVLTTSGSTDVPALVGVAENLDPNNRFSQPNRGVIGVTETVDDVTSQDVIDALAARRLLELSSAQATLEVTHAMVPLQLSDKITFTSRDISTTATVQAYSVRLEPGAQVAATWREISS